MLLHDILRPFGVNDHRDLAKAMPHFHPEHVRKFWNGHMPLSIRAAEAVKKLTNGTYTLDFLLTINRKPKRKKRTNSSPTARA